MSRTEKNEFPQLTDVTHESDQRARLTLSQGELGSMRTITPTISADVITRREKAAAENTMRRFNLNLPSEVVERLEELADAKGATIQTLIRRFIILGLTAIELEKNADDGLIIRRDGVDRFVTFF
jgi:predicted DNA-binding protein